MDENHTLEFDIIASANDAVQEVRSITVELNKLKTTLSSIDTNVLQGQFEAVLSQLKRLEQRHINFGLTDYEEKKVDTIYSKLKAIGEELASRGVDMKEQMKTALDYAIKASDSMLSNTKTPSISKKNPTLAYLTGQVLDIQKELDKAVAELEQLANTGIHTGLSDNDVERAGLLASRIEVLMDDMSKYSKVARTQYDYKMGVNIEPYQRATDTFINLINTLNTYSTEANAASTATQIQDKAVENLTRQLNTLYGKVDRLNTKSSKQVLSPIDLQTFDQYIAKYNTLIQALDKTGKYDTSKYKKSFSSIFSAVSVKTTNGLDKYTQSLRDNDAALQKQIQEQRQEQKALNETRRETESLIANLSRLEKLNAKHIKTGLGDIDIEKVREATAEIERLIAVLQEKDVPTNRFSAIFADLQTSLATPRDEIASTTGETSKLMSVLQGVGFVAKGIGSAFAIVGGAIKVVAKAARTVWNVFKKIGQTLKKIVSSIGKMVSGLFKSSKHSGSLSRFLSMASRMALRRVIQSIFKDMNEGFQALAKHSDSFNAAFSKIKYAIYDIRNAVVSAIAPLIEIIEPIVTKLLGWITAGIDKIGQALAALNGQKTYKRLKQGAFDYAKSLEKANKAQKQLISGLDEINKLGDNKDDDDNTLGFFIEEKVIDSDISKVFKHIRDLWNNGEYRETGRYIAQQANKWLKGIDFSDIRLKLNGFADRVVEAINGFFDEFEGDLLGEKIGEAINVALDFINRLLTGIEWNKVFATMGDGVKSLFKTLDEDSIATFIGGIGSVVSEFMMSIFEVIASPEVTDKLTLVIDKVTGKLNEALNDEEWRTRFTTSLGSAIASIINIVAYAIKSIDWKAVGTAVSEVIDVALNNTNGFNIGAAFGGISGAILDIIGNLDWDAICAKIKDGLSGLKGVLSEILGEDIKELGGNIVHSFNMATDSRYFDMAVELRGYVDNNEEIVRQLMQNGLARYDKNGDLSLYFRQWQGVNAGKMDWINIDSIKSRLGSELTKQLLGEVADGSYNVQEWAKRWSEELIVAVGDNSSSTATFHVGTQITSGIYEGMTSEIDSNSETYALDVLRAIREEMGIHSPSTVMRDEVGLFMGEGIGDGIVQAIPYVIQCASRLMAAVRAVFGSTINYNMGIGTNYGVSALPGIASATIGQVNGGRFGGNGESYMGILSAMLNALQQHSDVYIDGRKVTDVVTQRQRLDAKATGRPVYMSY